MGQVEAAIGSRWVPTVLCGSRSGYNCTALVLAGADADLRNRALRRLVAEDQDLAASSGAALHAFLYVPAAAADLRAVLRALGYVEVLLTGEAWLSLPCGGFGDYLRSLSKRRRHNVREEMERFQAAGLRITVEDLAPLCPRLGALLAAVQARYGHQADEARLSDMLKKWATNFSDLARTFVVRRGDETLAFSVFFVHDGVYYSRVVGFDYGRLGDEFAYFNVLFYGPIERALAEGARAVHYGIESLTAKLVRGCTVHPLYGYVWLEDRELLARLVNLYSLAVEARLNALCNPYRQKVDSGQAGEQVSLSAE